MRIAQRQLGLPTATVSNRDDHQSQALVQSPGTLAEIFLARREQESQPSMVPLVTLTDVPQRPGLSALEASGPLLRQVTTPKEGSVDSRFEELEVNEPDTQLQASVPRFEELEVNEPDTQLQASVPKQVPAPSNRERAHLKRKAPSELIGGAATAAPVAVGASDSGRDCPNESKKKKSAATPKDMLAIAQNRAASELIDLVGAAAFKSSTTSRLQADTSDDSLKRRLVNAGGKNGDQNIQLRLFLTDWQQFLGCEGAHGDRGDIFPISATDAETMRASVAATSATAARRVAPSMLHAKALGLDVEVNNDVLAPVKGRKEKRTTGGAREAAPPRYIYLLERALMHAQPGTILADYMCAQWFTFKQNTRFANWWISAFPNTDDDVTPGFTLVKCMEDKQRRLDVVETISCGKVTAAGLAPWAQPYITRYKKQQWMFADWAPASPSATQVTDPCTHAVEPDPDGNRGATRVRCCPKRKASVGFGQITQFVSKLTGAELAARKLSGTHFLRHVAPEIATLLGWSDPELNALGDWAIEEKRENAPSPRVHTARAQAMQNR